MYSVKHSQDNYYVVTHSVTKYAWKQPSTIVTEKIIDAE